MKLRDEKESYDNNNSKNNMDGNLMIRIMVMIITLTIANTYKCIDELTPHI